MLNELLILIPNNGVIGAQINEPLRTQVPDGYCVAHKQSIAKKWTSELNDANFQWPRVTHSYRKQFARQLRTQFVEGISVTLKSTLRVTQGHWKRNHWADHTRLTVRRVIGRWILSWPWNVGQSSLKVIESGTIWKFGYGFLTFPTLILT